MPFCPLRPRQTQGGGPAAFAWGVDGELLAAGTTYLMPSRRRGAPRKSGLSRAGRSLRDMGYVEEWTGEVTMSSAC